MFAIDTNVLVYAHFDGYPQHHKARAFCQQLLSGADDWCMSWQQVYEYLRITTHPAVHQRPLTVSEALADLRPYLNADNGHLLTHSGQHGQLLDAIASQTAGVGGNLVHDLHYAVLLREHGVSVIYSADSDFKKFGFLEVRDPTR